MNTPGGNFLNMRSMLKVKLVLALLAASPAFASHFIRPLPLNAQMRQYQKYPGLFVINPQPPSSAKEESKEETKETTTPVLHEELYEIDVLESDPEDPAPKVDVDNEDEETMPVSEQPVLNDNAIENDNDNDLQRGETEGNPDLGIVEGSETDDSSSDFGLSASIGSDQNNDVTEPFGSAANEPSTHDDFERPESVGQELADGNQEQGNEHDDSVVANINNANEIPDESNAAETKAAKETENDNDTGQTEDAGSAVKVTEKAAPEESNETGSNHSMNESDSDSVSDDDSTDSTDSIDSVDGSMSTGPASNGPVIQNSVFPLVNDSCKAAVDVPIPPLANGDKTFAPDSELTTSPAKAQISRSLYIATASVVVMSAFVAGFIAWKKWRKSVSHEDLNI